MAIRALILDFDGLILDTESPDMRAWEETFAAHGATLDRDWWIGIVGTLSAERPTDLLQRTLGRPIDAEAIRARTQARTLELLAGTDALPGVRSLVADASSRGLARGIASSSPRWWVEQHLTTLDLLGSFDAIRAREDVPVVKPDPALYRAAVDAVGVRPDEAIAFEDSEHGVAAAKAAGLYCVAVPNAVTSSGRFDAADLSLSSLDGLDLDALLDRAAR